MGRASTGGWGIPPLVQTVGEWAPVVRDWGILLECIKDTQQLTLFTMFADCDLPVSHVGRASTGGWGIPPPVQTAIEWAPVVRDWGHFTRVYKRDAATHTLHIFADCDLPFC